MENKKINIELEREELQEILFKRLELKYQGQLERLSKKYKDLESLIFNWVRKDREDIDFLKKELELLKQKGDRNSSQP